MADIIKRPAGTGQLRQTVITLRPGVNSSLKEITLIRTPSSSSISNSISSSCTGVNRPRQITLLTKYLPFGKRPFPPPTAPPTPSPPSNPVLLGSEKIPRPPNAFMIFANEWRKRLALQYPTESNKVISVRLGQLWKSMTKGSKEIYYQRSRQAGQDHKQKYPGYVYNPKEARLRKARRQREQCKGARNSTPVLTAWPRALTMNQHRQPLLSSTVYTEDNKSMLHEQVDRESSMLQSYPDYLEMPYNLPSNDYALDTQPWYPSYIQGGGGGGGFTSRPVDSKVPVDWTTPYSSEQGNYIRASPHSSPYSIPNHQELNSLILNGEHAPAEQTTPCEPSCLTPDHKPNVDQLLCQNNDITLVKEDPDLLNLSFSLDSLPWSSSFFSYPEAKSSSDMFNFQEPDDFLESNCLYSQENCVFNPQELFDSFTVKPELTEELKPQDLSGVAAQDHSPVIVSENDKCRVVLESSAIETNPKDYFSL